METEMPHSVETDGELARLLDEAREHDVLIERNGELYRLVREGDVIRSVAPDVTRQIIAESAGTLSVEDAERMKAIIYRAREEGTRPLDVP